MKSEPYAVVGWDRASGTWFCDHYPTRSEAHAALDLGSNCITCKVSELTKDERALPPLHTRQAP
jgi:hypothetical protein